MKSNKIATLIFLLTSTMASGIAAADVTSVKAYDCSNNQVRNMSLTISYSEAGAAESLILNGSNFNDGEYHAAGDGFGFTLNGAAIPRLLLDQALYSGDSSGVLTLGGRLQYSCHIKAE